MKPADASKRQSAWRARKPSDPVTVRVGLLGLGNVGQAVARLCAASRGQLRKRGIDIAVTACLVRDAQRAREFAPAGAQVLDDFDAFARQDFDLVIEVMGGVHPAFDFLERCLQSGIPIVTANKSLMAARGVELFQVAAEYGATLRCEASAIAGVPFLSALRDRPLISRVHSLSGILNGTSNYILTRMAVDGVSFADALRGAQDKGYAEPDPTLDVQGIDAAEKLVVILQHLGITGVRVSSLEVRGIDTLQVADFRQAHAFGGAIKPLVKAEITDETVRAFVGPAFIPSHHPLAQVNYERNGIRLRGPDIGDLVFTGPGAGPEVTAATILDDAVQIVSEGTNLLPPSVSLGLNDRVVEPRTSPWFVRCTVTAADDPGTTAQRVTAAFAQAGIGTQHVATQPNDTQHYVYLMTRPCDPGVLFDNLTPLEQKLGGGIQVFRATEGV